MVEPVKLFIILGMTVSDHYGELTARVSLDATTVILPIRLRSQLVVQFPQALLMQGELKTT